MECLQNKITTAVGVLQPTILTAILNLYLRGNLQMNAEMVRNECIIINNEESWNTRIPAICNSMRNAIECGGRIVGEDRDFLGFTIAFNGNSKSNLDQTKNNASPKTPLVNKEEKKKPKDNEIANKKIEECLENLDWDKLKDKNKPKLLIIGCCNAKQIQPTNIENINPINYNFGNEIEYARTARLNGYIELLDNPQNANYFNKKRDGVVVGTDYFQNALNGELIQAIDLYGSNGSPFYNPVMKRLYKDKIENNNLHLLIVSGLYGIIKHNDFINDYNLTINKGENVWGNRILFAVQEYILVNNIDNNDVFYSLSGEYLSKLNPVIDNWNNLWNQSPGRGRKQADDLKDFLENL
jgi:hypothetical protein